MWVYRQPQQMAAAAAQPVQLYCIAVPLLRRPSFAPVRNCSGKWWCGGLRIHNVLSQQLFGVRHGAASCGSLWVACNYATVLLGSIKNILMHQSLHAVHFGTTAVA